MAFEKRRHITQRYVEYFRSASSGKGNSGLPQATEIFRLKVLKSKIQSTDNCNKARSAQDLVMKGGATLSF